MGRKLPLRYPVCVPRTCCARSRIGRSAGAQGCSMHGRQRTYRVLDSVAEEPGSRVGDGPVGVAHCAARHGNTAKEKEPRTQPAPRKAPYQTMGVTTIPTPSCAGAPRAPTAETRQPINPPFNPPPCRRSRPPPHSRSGPGHDARPCVAGAPAQVRRPAENSKPSPAARPCPLSVGPCWGGIATVAPLRNAAMERGQGRRGLGARAVGAPFMCASRSRRCDRPSEGATGLRLARYREQSRCCTPVGGMPIDIPLRPFSPRPLVIGVRI